MDESTPTSGLAQTTHLKDEEENVITSSSDTDKLHTSPNNLDTNDRPKSSLKKSKTGSRSTRLGNELLLAFKASADENRAQLQEKYALFSTLKRLGLSKNNLHNIRTLSLLLSCFA